MNSSFLLDACALLAFLNNEHGADIVENVLLDSETQTSMHIVIFWKCITTFIELKEKRRLMK